MKPVDINSSTFIYFDKNNNKENSKFKVVDHVTISKYKNIFAKIYLSNWFEEVFVIKRVKNTVPWTYVISNLNGEEIVGTFCEKELQKTNQREYRIEKVIKKGYDNSFNSWVNKKDITTGVDTSQFTKKGDLADLKSEIDKLEKVPSALKKLNSKVGKLNIDKLAPVPNGLSKLIDVVKNDAFKKDIKIYMMLKSTILKIKYLVLLT